jgi:hypothetical protein
MSIGRNVILKGKKRFIKLRPRPRTLCHRAQDMAEGAAHNTSHGAVVIQHKMLT